MKKIILAALIAAAPAGFAIAAENANKPHPPEKAMDSATPEMKNPEGTKGLHPAQKAMDEATPTEKKSDSVEGAGSGTSGDSKTYNAQDANKAAGEAGDKQKIPNPEK